MKYSIVLLILIGTVAYNRPIYVQPPPAGASSLSWDSTKNWRIYKLHTFNRVVRISVDSLRFLEGTSLDDDSMHGYLKGCKELPKPNPVWMGCYLASYEGSDGHIRKAIISQYAGFFYSDFDKSFYEIGSQDQQAWLNYISSSYLKIP